MWLGNEATPMRQQEFTTGKLAGRAIVKIAGPDAQDFLHNLLTADIEALGPGDATYAALLAPQGKILFDMFVFFDGLAYFLDCAASQKHDLLKRLGMYRLRAAVTIGDDASLEAGVSPLETHHAFRYADPRCADLGWRMMAGEGRLEPSTGYEAARIALGLADSDADLGSGEFFPHEANLDQFGAVSFSKGCYVGQEVVSRMEHRGLARSRILPVMLNGPAPAKGAEIRDGDRLVGQLLSSSGNRALALIRLDRLAEAGAALLTESVTVTVLKPAWARYDVPGTKETA